MAGSGGGRGGGSKSKGRRRVCFQTSVEAGVEEAALATFLVFERGDSGDLSFNQFTQVGAGVGWGAGKEDTVS